MMIGMQRLAWIAWVSLAVAVGGCAVSRDAVRRAYETAQPCCETLAQLRYEKLPAQGPALFDIDERSPLFAFDTGRSFVLAVELPPLSPPYVVRIKSFALGDHIKESQIFFPAVLVLDERHAVLSRHVPPPSVSLRTADFTEATTENRWGLGLKLEWDLPIEHPAARYLVVHTTAEALAMAQKHRVPRFVPMILPGLVTTLPTGQEEVVEVPHSAFGRISLRVLPSALGQTGAQ
jgi:hypothetical protein